MDSSGPLPVEQAFADAGVHADKVRQYLGRNPDLLSQAERDDLLARLSDHKKGVRHFEDALAARLKDRSTMIQELATLRIQDREKWEAAAVDAIGSSDARPDRMPFEELHRFYVAAKNSQPTEENPAENPTPKEGGAK